jgi:hypothetical protein
LPDPGQILSVYTVDTGVSSVICVGIHLLRSISNVSCLLFVTVSSLRSEDTELIYWALCLLHELVMKDIQRKAAREIPGLIRTLNIVLSNHDSQYQKLILRIFSILAVKNGCGQ